jgi:hypothetical protein
VDESVLTIVDYLANLFTPHDLCGENCKRRIEVRVQALLEAADDTPLEKGRPCHTEINTFIEIENGMWN